MASLHAVEKRERHFGEVFVEQVSEVELEVVGHVVEESSREVTGNAGGESETLIGKWMKARGNRNRVLIATKVGIDMGAGRKGLSKARIFEAVDESLRRLQTDHIDLLWAHFWDRHTPVEEMMSAMDFLVKQGKERGTVVTTR